MPDSLLLAADAPTQCQALAPQAFWPHADLLPPVALHRPVALPTVSDPEEMTLDGGVCSQQEAMSPVFCCAEPS